MQTIPIQTRPVPGCEVRVGDYLTYLDQPFEVARIEPMEPHHHLGSRRIAYDPRGRGVIVYDAHDAWVLL